MGSLTWLKNCRTQTVSLVHAISGRHVRSARIKGKQYAIQAAELLEVRTLLAADSSLVAMAVLNDGAVEDDSAEDWYLQPFEFDAIFPRALPFDPSGLPVRVIEWGESIIEDEDGDESELFDVDGLMPLEPFDPDGLPPRQPFDVDGLMPLELGSFVDFKFEEIFGAPDFFHRLDRFDVADEFGELPSLTDLDDLSIEVNLVDNDSDEFETLDISFGDIDFEIDFPIHDFFSESDHGPHPWGRPLFGASDNSQFDFHIDLHEIPFEQIGAQFEQIVDVGQDLADSSHHEFEPFGFDFIRAMHLPHIDLI